MSDERRTRSIDEILDQVYRRGRLLRRRRRVARTTASMLAVVLLGGGMMQAVGGLRKGETLHFDDTPIESVSPKPSPVLSEKPTPVSSPKPTSKPVAKPAPKLESPKPKPPACLNSFDPVCGEFSWVTKPGSNQPLVITVEMPAVEAGTEASFTVRGSDADADILNDFWWIDFGDGTSTMGPGDKSCAKAYGPWSLPARKADSWEKTFTHTYAAPGTYTMWVKLISYDVREGKRPCQQAYGSYGKVPITVVVNDPSPPEPPPGP